MQPPTLFSVFENKKQDWDSIKSIDLYHCTDENKTGLSVFSMLPAMHMFSTLIYSSGSDTAMER